MEERAQLIVELREKFFKRIEEEGQQPESRFHPNDIAKVRTTDKWLKRFLEHNEYHLPEALDMLWDTCEWRKKFGTNDIAENNVRRDYLEDGICFSHGKDRDGKKLFVIKSKLHIKGAKDYEELQRCVVYWFERLERESNGDQITLFFDMVESGLSNLDMEFTKYLISLFKCYYPNFLNYIIILEMPWIFNAAFKIIKSWLPAKAIQKIKLVNKNTLKEYVDPSEALKCWGGDNDYTFTFVPESEVTPATVNGKLYNKKVHFNEESPLTEQPATDFGDKEKKETSMISINPTVLVFNKVGDETMCTITLKNITEDTPLSYKLKTTTPGRFRVRPNTGILLPSEQCSIKVSVQPGCYMRRFLCEEKFLLMCLPLTDANVSGTELAELWKQRINDAVEHHKLPCREAESENGDVLKSTSSSLGAIQGSTHNIDALYEKMIRTEECCVQIHNEVNTIKHMLIISIILTIGISIVAAYFIRMDMKYTDEQHCHLRQD